MVLEPPSGSTIKSKEATEEQSLHPSALDLALVSSTAAAEPPRKKKRGPKGPNPLSMKKKKDVDVSPLKVKGKDATFPNPLVDGKRVSDKRKRDANELREGQGPDEINHDEQVGRKRKRLRRKRATSSFSPMNHDILD